MILAPVCLSGCFGGGMMPGLDSADRSLTTGSVPAPTPAQTEKESDENTVRNAVSSADLSKMGTASIPWANASTGSAGVISSITEETNGGFACRTFTTTRHSYRGISNFAGQACLVGEGEWRLVRFKEAG
ncbi:RT0821/Lpp0805 family surface protein [Rhizobium sp. FKL33]|uniref:RT0821/Lpp0805 family surface protein n=1 Tax=Rhizobium sp. FKL33 TaxID=2562307 RepID=UPI001FEE87C0|nr:RT0821/Lpp0805 family surface protein [Rhizobium sp. FKL33]